jgi:hypothetical protein
MYITLHAHHKGNRDRTNPKWKWTKRAFPHNIGPGNKTTPYKPSEQQISTVRVLQHIARSIKRNTHTAAKRHAHVAVRYGLSTHITKIQTPSIVRNISET